MTSFINNDVKLYDEESNTPGASRTIALNEDLGQIGSIFSDKTGTLTRNEMEFRKFSLDGVSFGEGMTEVGRAAQILEGKEPTEVCKERVGAIMME